MTDLFQIIPPTLFRPLAAPGAPVYVRALFALFAETKRQYQPLSRELAVSLIAEILADPVAAALTVELDEEDATPGAELTSEDDDESARLQARSGALLRALMRYGWLRIETQNDFSQACILPDYAFRLLQVLEMLLTNDPPRLRGVVASIRDLLQAAVKESDEHVRIFEAQRQTQALMNGLKELQHNIGAHIEQVLRQLQAGDILQQFFTRYRDEIVDRAYHQLRTTDHVSRFRLQVLEALTQLEREEKLRPAARRMRTGGEAESFENAVEELQASLREMRESFETLDQRLHAIDLRHSQFVSSAVRAVELQLTASSTTSGQLHSLLTHLLTVESGAPQQLLPARYDRLVNLFQLGLVDEKSLAAPTRAPVPFVPEIVMAPALSEAEAEAARAQTLQALARAISRDRVRRWAAELLRDRAERRGGEIPLKGPEELPLVIYLRAYGDGSLGYQVEELPEGDWVEHGGVGFRDFVLRKTTGSNLVEQV
jgi:hypothetical protein